MKHGLHDVSCFPIIPELVPIRASSFNMFQTIVVRGIRNLFAYFLFSYLGWDGSDEWIRAQFKLYLLSLLSSIQHTGLYASCSSHWFFNMAQCLILCYCCRWRWNGKLQ